METVAKVVGHVYPVWSHYGHLTFHTRFQRHPHTDQWFDKSPDFLNPLALDTCWPPSVAAVDGVLVHGGYILEDPP